MAIARPERYKVDFALAISWQDPKGAVRRLEARCVDLSAAGAQVEAKDQLPVRTAVLLTSNCFGRMGNASVRNCRRAGMKYKIGLHFTSLLPLSDPSRRKILEEVLQKTHAPDKPSDRPSP